MKLTISNDAANWYKKELQLEKYQKLRLFVRYGEGGHIPGFSLGIRIDEPNQSFIKEMVSDIEFFIETSDSWYFEDTNLTIKLDNILYEPTFIYD